MILMSQIFDVKANENARYKRNELEFIFVSFDASAYSVKAPVWRVKRCNIP